MGTAMLGVRAMAQGASWSGKERNRLFMNQAGTSFGNPSGISGLDAIADGRCFAVLDMDRDGLQDVALVNTNAPRLELFRNALGDERAVPARFVALQLQGGNDGPRASSEWSARDGVGALVTVRAGELVMRRELRCGEGLSAQNSATLRIGLGAHAAADSVSVRWPSGREQRLESVPSGTLLSVYEDARQSPTGEAFVSAAYGPAVRLPQTGATLARPRLALTDTTDAPPLSVYTTTATWCVNCIAELPQFEHLREAFGPGQLALYGVPYDDEEQAADFAAYRAEHAPAYTLLEDLDLEQRAGLRELLERELGGAGLPASVVTNAAGEVLLTRWGLPTVSELRVLLAQLP